MCGIAVAINWDSAEAAVQRLIAGMLHRGDVTDPVVTVGNDTAMGTRRLRIVDAAHGAQPQASSDEGLLVCLNGEIYNHVEIRRELEALGVRFRTECDTEVVANALRTWGQAGIKRLSGSVCLRGGRHRDRGISRRARPLRRQAALPGTIAEGIFVLLGD